MKKPRHLFRNAIAVVLAALGVMTVTATTASAERTCAGGSGAVYDICFWVRPIGGDLYNVHVGFDYKIGPLDAQAIIAQPGDPVDAWAMGADPFFNNAEFNVPIAGEARVAEFGLSVDFDINVPYAALDEDSDGGDELFARVRVFDNRTPGNETFTTGQLKSPFDPD